MPTQAKERRDEGLFVVVLTKLGLKPLPTRLTKKGCRKSTINGRLSTMKLVCPLKDSKCSCESASQQMAKTKLS